MGDVRYVAHERRLLHGWRYEGLYGGATVRWDTFVRQTLKASVEAGRLSNA